MSETLFLSAEAREKVGKGASRVLRRAGRIPAVIYGGNLEPIALHLEEKALVKALGTGHFFNSIVDLNVGGIVVRTLPKDVALHKVSDRPLHVDFLRVSATHAVHVKVPLLFINEEASPGIKRGGVLNIVAHELELVSIPEAIPNDITVDVTGLEIGDSIHMHDIKLPDGVRAITHESDATIATIVAPSALKSSEGDTAKD
ncbi:50S ribosomal protein L25/general stress protein Ctc [Novosphingobium sp. Fuku2-ISO-50]|jgi:large subunit ribosomal protein L25|uniref:50S ribosomal protein L25/general stress protein Ctc n=1 Tax=Novosphingobium sp. Fuku2-ISO-50 TaxID=1739114 RepID=UPI00076DC39E|nr:50S ribosomal protein L25/general stress protein Ctc [Novosphingobium sp. Fuku2-ISO-50]KUR79211.1 50S ribosomal protein L25 [Novosphingobium sp. Fuku2-ISO-50]